MWLRRTAFDSVGGFPPGLSRYGGDDQELGTRLTAHGRQLVYAPEVHLTHPPRQSAREVCRKAFRLGYSQARRRRLPGSPLNGSRPAYTNLRAFVIGRRLRGMHRLGELEYQPTLLQLGALHVARWAMVQIPMLVGEFVGEQRQSSPSPSA
jgi:GT2 family glycosyltransferase